MKLPEIAIVVSSASALFTGSNVLISALTYKRVRPKVKVRLWRSGVSTGTERNPEATQYQFILRFLNNGITSVSVERIELVAYVKRFRPGDLELVRAKRFQESDPDRPLVPGLGGATYRFHIPQRALVGGEEPEYLRFRILLANGRTAQSRKIKQEKWLLPRD